jgi:hypothetical protein
MVKKPMLPTLPRSNRPATVRPVKYFLLLAVSFLAGCQTYTKISVSDLSGAPISDWVAEGKVKKVPEGFIVKAVERNTPPPFPTHNRYPNGRVATVVGPNIILQEIDKPDWLVELDGE